MPTPLFICHANCCRSALAHYLYEQLCPGCPALSAGVEAGDEINYRAAEMLRSWSALPAGHRPRQLTRALCDEADGIFLMGPEYLRRLLGEYGPDLAEKAYLFADPFTAPRSFSRGEYLVYDPSFDNRSVSALLREFSWLRDRVKQINEALHGKAARPLIPATRYAHLL